MSQQPPNDLPQPPYQPYPQQPMYPPPGAPPKKKSKTWLWIVLAVVAVLILGCIGFSVIASNAAKTVTNSVATTVATTAATAANTQPPSSGTWKTTHTFIGNGSKKTATFTAPDDWKIVWKCNPTSFGGNNYNVIIVVNNTDGSMADSGVNATCSKSNTHDETEVHTSGQVYLDITSEGDWTIQVQSLK